MTDKTELLPCPECRMAFEKWYSGENPNCPSIKRNGHGYPLMQTQMSWAVWEVAWSTRATPYPVTKAEAVEALDWFNECAKERPSVEIEAECEIRTIRKLLEAAAQQEE